ncbi:MAG TPA: V-type ATP synthase subunit E family protein [Candidatus Bathyarchaeia archaeon]|nr:V-type ATP synthase subunit E family protein [Candidatus Bathyarchaeia archaeon]
MGLEVVVQDVLARGEQEANRIRQEGTDEANAMIAGAENSARQILAEKKEQTAEQIERRKNREISSANLEVKRTILNAKKELLDRVYNEAIEQLASLPESERESIIKRLLETQTDAARVFSNKHDEPLVKRISNLEYGGTIRCSGGIMLENEDGSVIRDLTFDSLLISVREQSLKQLLEILSV